MHTSNSFFVYDINKKFIPPQSYKTLIRKVVVNNDSLIFNGNFSFKDSNKLYISEKQQEHQKTVIIYKNNSIKFEFSALFYENTESIEYSYYIENFNKNWSRWSSETKAVFTNLHEGKYTFKVKAKNIYGFESEIETYEFTILPPWYRTWWAISIYAILFILFILGIVKLSLSRVIKQKIKLEAIVKERTAEIQQQNEEIQTQADNLLEINDEMKLKNAELFQQKEEIQAQSDNLQDAYEEINEKNEHIIASVRYASTIQTAILPFEERMKKYLDIFILYSPKDIVSGDFYWFIHLPAKNEFSEKKFIATVDCTGHGVPGAFMSMIGMQLLNKIVSEDKILNPAEILLKLHKGIIYALKQEKTENSDGMDVCLCKFRPQKVGL